MLTRQIGAARGCARRTAAPGAARRRRPPCPPRPGRRAAPALGRRALNARAAAVTSEVPANSSARSCRRSARPRAALGVNPSAMLAQAALETGWGKRMARTADGAPSLNLFGIKADERLGRRACDRQHGGIQRRRRGAAAGGVPRLSLPIEDSVSDFAHLLQSSPRYRDTLADGSDPGAYVASIGSPATRPIRNMRIS